MEMEGQKVEEQGEIGCVHAFESWSQLYSVSDDHPVSVGLEICCVCRCVK